MRRGGGPAQETEKRLRKDLDVLTRKLATAEAQRALAEARRDPAPSAALIADLEAMKVELATVRADRGALPFAPPPHFVAVAHAHHVSA